MDTMSWTIFVFVFVDSMRIGSGEKSCVIWTSVGPANIVQLGHGFQVYCTFKRQCTMSMKVFPATQQQPKELNSTTMCFDVLNITRDRTYSCMCANIHALDSCGVDVFTGYPPDRPQDISCIYKVVEKESGVVVCTWDRGRDTRLAGTAVLWVRSEAGNRSGGAVSYNVSSKGTETPSVSFPALRSVQHISVWVQVENKLATVSSSITNFTLSDIAMPSAPDLCRPECLVSFTCIITVQLPVSTELVEIQHRADQEPWITSHPVVPRNSPFVWSISSLEPYRFYHFRARAKFSRGFWSPWSTNGSSWTQEEAPAKELNVWFAQSDSDSESWRVYWKEENVSISRGKIIEYRVSVGHHRTPDISLTADVRNYSVPHCTDCVVTVWARNSKGSSPPARITTQHVEAEPPQDVRVTTSNNSVAISWREPGTASHRPSGYVVEWYPQGHKLEELRWLRLGQTDRRAVLSGILPLECYEGAVYDLYKENPGKGTKFEAFATSESAPTAGPTLRETVDGNTVTVTWKEVPRGQRGGCIAKYTVYLESDSGLTRNQSVRATKRTYSTSRLSPGDYSLWISASTAKGEGPKSRKVKFFIERETSWSLLIMSVVIFAIVLLLICLCQNSTAKQRFLEFFQCSLCDVVPDPANSKWAKECSQEKGKMKLQLQLSHPSVSGEEEEPILVDVEELPRQRDDAVALTGTSAQSSSSHLPPQTGLNPDTNPASLLYPLTTYIKSYSLDSDCSDHTSTSVDTGTTVDYISSHGPDNLYEEDEEEMETQFVEMRFFPSQNIFKEPLDFGGKLTLDAVKINCSGLFHNFQGDSAS